MEYEREKGTKRDREIDGGGKDGIGGLGRKGEIMQGQ